MTDSYVPPSEGAFSSVLLLIYGRCSDRLSLSLASRGFYEAVEAKVCRGARHTPSCHPPPGLDPRESLLSLEGAPLGKASAKRI